MSPEEDNECWRLAFKSLMLGIALGSFFMYVALNWAVFLISFGYWVFWREVYNYKWNFLRDDEPDQP